MTEDRPADAVDDKISLREVQELAALLSDDEQVPNCDDMERAAAALEALVRLYDAAAQMRGYPDIETYCGSLVCNKVDAALAEFTDDREVKGA